MSNVSKYFSISPGFHFDHDCIFLSHATFKCNSNLKGKPRLYGFHQNVIHYLAIMLCKFSIVLVQTFRDVESLRGREATRRGGTHMRPCRKITGKLWQCYRGRKLCKWAGFLPQGAPPSSSSPPQTLPPSKIWSENNRKISITTEICITIHFVSHPKTFPGRKPDW